MSKPKRPIVAAAMEEAEQNEPITLSRDNVIPLPDHQEPEASAPSSLVPAEPHKGGRGVRHSYRATLYLPRDAQFKLKEIAIMRRCKAHDVLMEAVAEMFDKHNAGDVARQIRSSRDNVKA